MEHIVNSETEGIDFTRYSAYVDSIRHELPPHVYSFASDSRYFDLESHSSLHDAWLEDLTVREVASGERHQIRRVEIALSLLGSFHDRRIHLHYTGVTHYSFAAQSLKETHHGDLFTHEIRVGAEGHLVHELLFARGTTFFIECADIRHSEEIVTPHT